jgi:hypothetical protein
MNAGNMGILGDMHAPRILELLLTVGCGVGNENTSKSVTPFPGKNARSKLVAIPSFLVANRDKTRKKAEQRRVPLEARNFYDCACVGDACGGTANSVSDHYFAAPDRGGIY